MDLEPCIIWFQSQTCTHKLFSSSLYFFSIDKNLLNDCLEPDDAVVNSTCSRNIFPFFRCVMLESTIFRCRNICCTFGSSNTQCGRHQGLGIWHFKQITPSIITTDLLKNSINCYKIRIWISKLFKVMHTQLTEELNQKFLYKLKNREFWIPFKLGMYMGARICLCV